MKITSINIRNFLALCFASASLSLVGSHLSRLHAQEKPSIEPPPATNPSPFLIVDITVPHSRTQRIDVQYSHLDFSRSTLPTKLYIEGDTQITLPGGGSVHTRSVLLTMQHLNHDRQIRIRIEGLSNPVGNTTAAVNTLRL